MSFEWPLHRVLLDRLTQLLRWATVDQYARIDADHRTETAPDGKLAWMLLAITTSLIVSHYFGGRSFVRSIPGATALFDSWPHPKLYPHLYWALFKTVNYFLLPALVIKFVFRERLRDFGLTGSHGWRVLLLYVALIVAVLPVTWIASGGPEFLATYPKYKQAAGSFDQLLLWEFSYGFQFFLLELFFRGFALFILARYFGHAAIFIMVIPYAMIHFSKPLPETIGSILAGVVFGTIALRTWSITRRPSRRGLPQIAPQGCHGPGGTGSGGGADVRSLGAAGFPGRPGHRPCIVMKQVSFNTSFFPARLLHTRRSTVLRGTLEWPATSSPRPRRIGDR